MARRKDDRVRFGDVFDDNALGGRKFDFVFVNAACNPHRTKADIAEASLDKMRDDGMMFFRFFVGEDTNWQITDLKDMLEKHNCYLVELHQDTLPEGDYVLSFRTFVIKKQPFKNSITETFAKSLGDLKNQMNELRKAA
jgi:hypothetical protein